MTTPVSYGSTSTRPRLASDFVYAGSATLDNSNLIQLNWDALTFNKASTDDQESKQRLILAARQLVDQLESALMRSSTTPASFK